MPESSSNPVIHEMKIWFLEQKVRQLELDVHRRDTKLMLINENMGQHNKQKSKMNTNNAPVGDRLSRTSITTNDTATTVLRRLWYRVVCCWYSCIVIWIVLVRCLLY
jgi:hypothetical protein